MNRKLSRKFSAKAGNSATIHLKETSTISVLGCGWLGLPLAEYLIDRGYQVKGSVSSEEKLGALRQKGVQASVLVLHEDSVRLDDQSFFDTGVVIVSVPPRRTEAVERIFPAQMRNLIVLLEQYGVPKVIFISSTSVYREDSGIAKEEHAQNPEKDSGRALLMAERMFVENRNFRTTVVRFGGLIGADRNPMRFLSRQKKIPDGSRPVNLIHRDDCVRILYEIIRQEAWGEIFNACCPFHPLRREFYEKASALSGLPLPEFGTEPESIYKTVDSSKLIDRLHYTFAYPSPMDWLGQLNADAVS